MHNFIVIFSEFTIIDTQLLKKYARIIAHSARPHCHRPTLRSIQFTKKKKRYIFQWSVAMKIPLSSKSGPLADPDVAKHGIGILRARKVRRAGCERSELAAGEGVV